MSLQAQFSPTLICESENSQSEKALNGSVAAAPHIRTQALKVAISVFLLVGIILLVGFYFNTAQILRDLRRLSGATAAIVFIALFANVLLAVLRFKVIATQIKHPITFRRAMAVVGAGSLGGVIFFQIAGQLMARGVIAGRSGIPFAGVVVITAYERFIAALVSGLLALGGAMFIFGNLYFDWASGGAVLIKIMIGLTAAATGGAFLGYGRLAARAITPLLTRHFLWRCLVIIGLTLLVQLPMMVAYVTAAHALSPQVSIVNLTAASAIVMFAASIPISFAGWGIREMSAVVALGAIGVAAYAALTAAVTIGIGSMLAMGVAAAISLPASMGAKQRTEADYTESIDYYSVLTWVLPIGVATLVFFQIYIPIGGTLLNVNLADPLAILGGVLFVLKHVQKRHLPTWRYRYTNCALAAATLVLTISLFIGAAQFGFTKWALVNRYGGWFILLAYAASGALVTKDFGREAFRVLLLTFVGAAVSIAALELFLLLLNNIGVHLTLPLAPREIEGFSLNHNFFGFQLLMALPVAFVAVKGRVLRILVTAILLTALYFSGSRSAWITVFIVLAASVYVRATTIHELSIATACAVCVALVIITPSAINGDSLSTLPLVTMTASENHMRMTSILGGLNLFQEHPILGAGLGAFRNKLIIFPGHEPLLIHSTSVWLLAELGAIGLLIFAVPALYALFVEMRRRVADPAGQMIALCLLAFGVMSLPADMLYQRTLWLLLGAALMLKPSLNYSTERLPDE